MPDIKKSSDFHKQLDSLTAQFIDTLNGFEKSQILQNYFFSSLESVTYATIIDNFFSNITEENILELKIPVDKINTIKKEYLPLQNDVKKILSGSASNKFDKEKYYNFKVNLDLKFSEYVKILSEIEKIMEIKELEKYLIQKKSEIELTGKENVQLEDIVMTKSFELYLNTYHEFPTTAKFGKIFSEIAIKSLETLANELMKTLKKDRPRMLKEHKKIRRGFEQRLDERWKVPFDLLETMIVVCLESGEDKKNKFSKGTTITNPKKVALIKIHARSIQIAYEILSLVRSGFADGAHARWRSIHELAMVAMFLLDSDDEVSVRYLKHDIMKKFKESQEYEKYYELLGYDPPDKKDLDLVKEEHDKMIQKYGNEFEYRMGLEWIPVSIIPNRTFRALEEHVKMDKFHPFYVWSSNAIHGGSKGFENLGVMGDIQNHLLVVGPTNYGFADPIDQTSLSLSHVTSSLLLLESDFEDILMLHAIQKHTKEIGQCALDVQNNLKQDIIEQNNEK